MFTNSFAKDNTAVHYKEYKYNLDKLTTKIQCEGQFIALQRAVPRYRSPVNMMSTGQFLGSCKPGAAHAINGSIFV